MRLLGRIHTVGVTFIAIAVALVRIVIGLLAIAGAIWLLATDIAGPSSPVLAIVLFFAGVAAIVGALGVFGDAPTIDRGSLKRTRKALRRAGMLGKH